METTNKEELYTLPFFQKLDLSLRIQLLYSLGWLWVTITPILVLLNYEKIMLMEYRFDPVGFIVIYWGLSVVSIIYWIKTRNNYISITENGIEKKTRKGIKKIQWAEISDVQLFDKIIDEYGTLKELNYGPSIGIILKDQSIWEKHKNNVGKYYMVISKAYFDEIDIDKLYLTIKSQIDKHNSDSFSGDVSSRRNT